MKRYVRSKWRNCATKRDEHNRWLMFTDNAMYRAVFADSLEKLWAAAADFTIDRDRKCGDGEGDQTLEADREGVFGWGDLWQKRFTCASSPASKRPRRATQGQEGAAMRIIHDVDSEMQVCASLNRSLCSITMVNDEEQIHIEGDTKYIHSMLKDAVDALEALFDARNMKEQRCASKTS